MVQEGRYYTGSWVVLTSLYRCVFVTVWEAGLIWGISKVCGKAAVLDRFLSSASLIPVQYVTATHPRLRTFTGVEISPSQPFWGNFWAILEPFWSLSRAILCHCRTTRVYFDLLYFVGYSVCTQARCDLRLYVYVAGPDTELNPHLLVFQLMCLLIGRTEGLSRFLG